MLEQDSPPAACLSASPSSRLGGKGQDGKKMCRLLTGLPGGHTPEEGVAGARREILQRLGSRSHSSSLLLILPEL